MEIVCIGFLLGVVFSMIVFGTGVIYGDRMDKRTHGGNVDNSVPCNDDSNVCNRDMGNVHGEVNCRRCLGFLHEEVTGDDMK